MACPWFLPRTPIRERRGAVAQRAPLGELWTGMCRAPGQEPAAIGETLCNPCNTGYAGRACSRFPQDGPADAVRFHVTSDKADELLLQYVFERQWWPAGHGVLQYSVTRGEVSPAAADEILRAQAEAFAKSWIFKTRPES